LEDYLACITEITSTKLETTTPCNIKDQHRQKQRRTNELKGTMILNKVQEDLKNLPGGDKVSIIQNICISEYIKACLPLIYYDEFEKYKTIILAKFNITRHFSIVLVRISRRVGKSLTIVYFAWAMVKNVPYANTDIYAQSVVMSQINLKKIKTMFLLTPEKNFVIVANNANTFKIHVQGETLPKEINARSQLHNVICLFVCFLGLKVEGKGEWKERKGGG